MKRSHIIGGALVLMVIGGALLFGQGLYIHAKAQLAQVLLRSAWQRTLAGDGNTRPWPWADTSPVGRLRVPALDVDEIVLAGDSGRVLAFGPGVSFGYALPGQEGITLISAHRDTHFRFLQDLRIGDGLVLQDQQGIWHHYQMTETHIVDVRQSPALQWTDASVLLLVTCYPFNALVPGGPLRYVVAAEEVAGGHDEARGI